MNDELLLPLLLECPACGRLSSEGDCCDDCGRYCCPGCLGGHYVGFSYWDGDVDYVVTCAMCAGWEPEIGVWL